MIFRDLEKSAAVSKDGRVRGSVREWLGEVRKNWEESVGNQWW